MKPLNKRISEARKALGMTQEQVAEAMNVSRQTVSHWENGRMQPDETIKKHKKYEELFVSFSDTLLIITQSGIILQYLFFFFCFPL